MTCLPHRIFRSLGLGVLTFFAPLCTPAQVTDTTTVVAVEVPVHVLLDGEPLRGLGPEDFEILDGRKKRPILDFEEIDLTTLSARYLAPSKEPTEPTAAPALPTSARRHFLLFFDLSFSHPQSIVEARKAAADLVLGGLHTTDLVAVATYSGNKGVQLLHAFTSDRAQTALAIETLGAPGLLRRERDPLGLLFGNLDDAIRSVERQGRGGPGTAEALIDFARALERQERRETGERIVDLTESMGQLARLLDRAPGRKHVVYLSEGFDTSILFGTSDRGAQRRMTRALETGRIWEVDSEERFGDSRGQSQLERMLEALRRADCTLQTVDIGGLRSSADVDQGNRRAFERDRATLAGQDDALAVLAGSTGGEHIRHFNDLGQALGEVLERTSVTYLLTFQPEDLALDGAYHRLRVRLVNAPKGARVVHRPGYFAPRPFSELAPEEQRLSNANLLLSANPEGGTFTTSSLALADLSAAGNGPRWVSLLVAVDGQTLLASAGGREALVGLDLYTYAFDTQGTVRDYLTQALTVDLTSTRPLIAQGGLELFAHLDLPPGQYRLRTLVRQRDSGAFGVTQTSLEVPGVDRPFLAPPLFTGALGRSVLVREDLPPDTALPPFPFLLGGQPFLPHTAPRLTQGTVAGVALLASGYAEAPRTDARVLDASGAEASVNLALGPAEYDPAASTHRYRLELDTSNLAPGSYQLEVHAQSGEVSSAPFEVLAP